MPGGTQDWFYHAPAKRSDSGPKDYPAASQIPLIGGNLPYDEWEQNERDDNGMKRGWIRDSDTKYIQLCKKGGRKDLLRFREPPPRSEQPKEYSRPEWMYQEAVEETDNKGPYSSHLPDYMVYEEYKADSHGDSSPAQAKRPPFSLDDKMTAFERYGDSVTDKMKMKIPNDESKLRKPPKNKIDVKDYRRKKQVDKNANSAGKSRHAKIPTPETYHGAVQFGKLLSNGYQEDWYTNRDIHYSKHKPASADVLFEAATRGDRQSTEYRDAINRPSKPAAGAGAGSYAINAMEVRGTKKSEQMKEMNAKQGEDKELFKLSKFDKVGSKVKSRWSETHEHSSPIMDASAHLTAVAPVSTK